MIFFWAKRLNNIPLRYYLITLPNILAMNFKILSINPGSTSTKIAVYNNEEEIFVKNIKHSANDIAKFPTITSQFKYRKDIIINELIKNNFNIVDFDSVIGRGGLIKPISSGIYEVNEKMIYDLENSEREHASNLGGLIAYDISKEMKAGTKAYIANPVVVDEMQPIAKISGHPDFTRRSIFHALNQKAIAMIYAKDIGKKYEDLNLIVAHLGGGISVGVHKKGQVIDVNNALDGDGAFSPERSGSLPMGDVVELCFSGKRSKEEVKKMLVGKGGMVAYLGTNDAYEVEKGAEKNEEWAMIQDAMCYQVAKDIGAMATVVEGKVDAILITGGMARGKIIVDNITKRVEFIAKVKAYPGEDEMKALAMNALSVLKGNSSAKTY